LLISGHGFSGLDVVRVDQKFSFFRVTIASANR